MWLDADDHYRDRERLVERLDRLGREPAAGEPALRVRVLLDPACEQQDDSASEDPHGMPVSQRLIHENDVSDPGAGCGEVKRLARELERRGAGARVTRSVAGG